MAEPIYLDYNATSPMRPSVRAAMHALDGVALNPSSVHRSGRYAKRVLEEARAAMASALAVFAHEVRFVGSATEANNHVLRHYAKTHALLVSSTEHASIHKTGELLGASQLPVHANGLLDMKALDAQLHALGARNALVSVMLVNNETGVIQPISDIATIVHAHGAVLHVDAVQALGKLPIDCGVLGADLMTLCGHKVGGPVGVGVLVVRDGVAMSPLITGGGQEQGFRAGTENVVAVAGLHALMDEVADSPEAQAQCAMRDDLEQRIARICPHAQIFAVHSPRVCNTVQLSMPGVSSETQLMHFDLAGIEVSAGSACSSGRVAPSHVLAAMGVSKEAAGCALRISFGWGTTPEHIDLFVKQLEILYARRSANAA
jgi:cysteine desulfurase